MKTLLLFLVAAAILVIPVLTLAQDKLNFDDYFVDKTMRIDYFHVGNSKSEDFSIDSIYQQGIWAGNTKNLIDDKNIGKYYYKIYDSASKKLIFSKGLDAYFGEYRTTIKGKCCRIRQLSC